MKVRFYLQEVTGNLNQKLKMVMTLFYKNIIFQDHNIYNNIDSYKIISFYILIFDYLLILFLILILFQVILNTNTYYLKLSFSFFILTLINYFLIHYT